MKFARTMVLIAISLVFATTAWAGPFKSSRVCVPLINPGELPLEFRIVEKETCAEGETLMEVREQGGATILSPYSAPEMDPEAQRVLENYKKYNGISR